MPPNSRMITLDSDVFKCCQNLHTLGWDFDAEAKRLLQLAADQVKPLMARRRWAVPHVHEFYPPTPNLLGMNHNHGQRIDIRLRSPRDRTVFLSEDAIRGTLLHELAHIEVGPHNAAFYKLLDELTAECERDIISGATATGVSGGAGGPGDRLGGGVNVPRYRAAERAEAAARRRAAVSSVMPRAGGQALGGGTAEIAALCDPREMALAAAERRRNDDLWCSAGSGTGTGPGSGQGVAEVVVVPDDPEVIEVVDVDAESAREEQAQKQQQQQRQRQQAGGPSAARPTSQTRTAGRGRPVRRRRGAASRVPVRENPAALAALNRAGRRQ